MANLEIIHRSPRGEARATQLLFVHGAWHGAWCWDRYFLPYFAENGYDSYAVSLRNHGNSDAPGSLKTVRISDYVEDVASAVDAIGSLPVIVGHSMGGFVLQKYLERHPAAGAVLFAPAPYSGVLPVSLGMLRSDTRAFLRANVTMSLYPLVGTPDRAKRLFFSDDMPDEEVAGYHAQLQDESYLAFLGMLFTSPRPMRIQTTPLVLGGEADTVFPPEMVRATAAAYGTEAVLFEDTAHDMMLESNWKVVADYMLAWLSEKGHGANSPCN